MSKLEAIGKLHRSTKSVDKDWQISAVSKVVFESIVQTRRPALFFEKVQGFETQVVAGVLGASRSIYFLTWRLNSSGHSPREMLPLRLCASENVRGWLAVASPDGTDRVLRDERIGRQGGMFMLDGLADQHAVERILMERRQLI